MTAAQSLCSHGIVVDAGEERVCRIVTLLCSVFEMIVCVTMFGMVLDAVVIHDNALRLLTGLQLSIVSGYFQNKNTCQRG